ncbi:O-antigen ligase family protein [Thermosulfidibacter takaii]|nr:O-antigen ligase family protein [Thermosulfidibacter takaii]
MKYEIKSIRLVGYQYLISWFFILLIFAPRTTILLRSIGYIVWLFVLILLVGLISTLISTEKQFYKIFDYYIKSFYYISLFGLLQFILGLSGVDILVTQKWLPNLIRINGFSYEPSYYASYLIIGWSLLFYLINKSKKYKQKYKKVFFLITLSIILSSSRMGILTMFLISFSYYFISSLKILLFRFSINKSHIRHIIILFLVLVLIICFIIKYWDTVKFLLAGLAIGVESAHSTKPRITSMMDTLKIFLNSPIIGYSLGGIASGIAKLHGVYISTQLEAKHYEGMNIFLQVLAASGLIGFTFFLSYLSYLFYKACIVSKRVKLFLYDYSIIIKGLCFSLFWELFILSLNQNILRNYLWIAIAMLSTSILIGKKHIKEKNDDIDHRL